MCNSNAADGGTAVHAESCIFEHDGPARLLFPAAEILKVRSSDGRTVYREGVDFVHEAGSDLLTRPHGSAAPVLTNAEKYPPPGSKTFPDPDASAVKNAPGKPMLRFDARMFFAEHQVEVDYVPLKTDWPEGAFAKSPLFRGFPKKKALLMAAFGDSITEGYNASAFIGAEPYRKPYAGLVADGLSRALRVPVELRNMGVGGANCLLLRKVVPEAVLLKPDLVTISFCMNDLSSVEIDPYIAEFSTAVTAIRKALPECVILLASSMTGNNEWMWTPRAKTLIYRNALKKYAEENRVIFADVFPVWEFAVNRKGFMSMTGNGVNHPNDWGHTIYARVILGALGVP